MAAKLLHSLTDDNSDLQKQIGCMTGVFQLFDRHHIGAGRRNAGHSPKRLPPAGSSHFNNGTLEIEPGSIHQQASEVEKHSNKSVLEKHRISTESSRASFSSSSRSSSFSSLDCNKTTQPEPLSFDQISFPETPSRDPRMSQSSASSPQLGRQILDLRDVVKDSMYREARGIPLKITAKEEALDRVVKHRDYPRPLQQSKNNDGAYSMDLKAKQIFPIDLKESVKVLAKLQEAPWYFDEPREFSRSKSYQLKDGSSFSISKDAPRFSYDGRAINRLSFESRDTAKPTLKLKELPRLSLDSRESSMRSLNSDSKSNLLPRNPKRDNFISFDEGPTLQKKLGTPTRPPSVVAKLMGLETLPDSALASDSKSGSGSIRTRPVEDFNSLPRSPKTNDLCGPIRMPHSSRSSSREPKSPRWKNPDIVMKPISRFPIEPAPWKQLGGARSSQKPASRIRKAPAKAHSPFPSVYSEIEKRLEYLEFTQSGKDLRALKQILEAMQAKGLLETRKKGQDSHFSTQKDQIAPQNTRLRDQIISSAKMESNSLRAFESSIVIMKPAKLVERTGINASSVVQLNGFADTRKVSFNSKSAKDQIPKNSCRDNADMKSGGRHARPAQTLTRQQQSGKSSESISPRLQQKKLELEKRSRPPTPPSDSSKPRKQSNKQQLESSSPGGRRRPKYSNFQQNDDQCSEISTRKLRHQETDMSRSNFDMVSNSKVVTSSKSPSMKVTDYSPGSIQKKSTPTWTEDASLAELGMVAPEYPSPVSVLDDAVYMDDAPSPMKHMLQNTLKDYVIQNRSDNFAKGQCEAADGAISNTIGSGLTSEINRKKLQDVEHLVQKLRRLNSGHDEARTDYIASLCENTNPDHRYISETLLASGLLLRDLGSSLTTFQLHPSGHPINPELFLVLEQTKSSNLLREECVQDQRKPDKEKLHRKLIFDTVNEILAGKLALVGHSLDPWLRSYKLERKALNAQKLLRDLCLEIEQLQAKKPEWSRLGEEEDGLRSILWEDVTCHSESWTDFHSEIPVIVLDVERLIFKDLVDEIVIGEASGRRVKPRRCRQLFVK